MKNKNKFRYIINYLKNFEGNFVIWGNTEPTSSFIKLLKNSSVRLPSAILSNLTDNSMESEVKTLRTTNLAVNDFDLYIVIDDEFHNPARNYFHSHLQFSYKRLPSAVIFIKNQLIEVQSSIEDPFNDLPVKSYYTGKNVILKSSWGVPVLEDGTEILNAVTCDHHMRSLVAKTLETRKTISHEELSGCWFPMLGSYASNMGHFILQFAFQIKMIQNENINCGFIIPQKSVIDYTQAQEWLELLGVPKNKIYLYPECDLLVEKCILTSSFTIPGHIISKSAFEYVRKIKDQVKYDKKIKRKLYFVRGEGVLRRLTNENEVIKELEKDGFEIIYYDELSIASKIKLAQETDSCVFPSGCGFLWGLFSTRRN